METGVEGMMPRLMKLVNRQEILDCINRYARAIDRHDKDLILSCFHEEAIDEHGNDINPMPRFADWANEVDENNFAMHLHNITTHNCDLSENAAHCDSYVIAGLSTPDRSHVWLVGGRYIDRLVKDEKGWRIILRRTIVEWVSKSENILEEAAMQSFGYPEGTWDKSDPTYQRPLQTSFRHDKQV